MSRRKPSRAPRDDGRDRKLSWRFSPQARLYLAGSFSFGLAQAQLMLFLNFFLRAQGLSPGWQGLVNALPALSLALACLPAVAFARRVSNARTLQVGAALATLGFVLLATSGGLAQTVAGTLVQGTGSAFMMVAGAAFMTNHSTEEQRVPLFSLQLALMTGAGFVGNLVGGRVPQWYGAWAGESATSLESVRMALLAGALFQLLGLLPMAFLRPSGRPRAVGHPLAVRAKGTMLRLVFPNLLVGLGAGATIPFLNIFIEGKFGVSYASLGTLFAWTSLATAATVLLQPLLVRRFGRIRAILIVQGGSLPFLALLGFAPSLTLVALAMFTRGALMNAAGPVYSAYAMDSLPEEDRPMYSAVNTIAWDIGWAAASLGSGVVRSVLPFGRAFDVLFGVTILMYSLSVVAIYVLLYRRERSATTPRTQSAGGHE